MIEEQLSQSERINLIKKIPVFSNLNYDALSELAGMMTERQARSQEPVFKKGDDGAEMFILVDGEVRVHDGNHVHARLKSGDVFGEFALIDNEKRSASVTTEKPCLLLQLDRKNIMPFIEKYPAVLMGMLQTQIKRMRDMNELEDKLSKSYIKITKQKEEIEVQNSAISEQKYLLEEQNAQLTELNEQKRQLMSVLIHGLKNPLTSAMMMADMLDQDPEIKADAREYVSILKQSMLRMDDVFNQIIRSNQKEEAE